MNSDWPVIREINKEKALMESVGVIRDSFETVAIEFGLTVNNCPTHPSFITLPQLKDLKKKGSAFFGLFSGVTQIGFVAVERASATLYYIEKLAVLPEYRRQGYGRRLMESAIDYIRDNNGQRVSVGIINEHKNLKSWYQKMDFVEISTTIFPHLPFIVCFMERDLDRKSFTPF